jgi:hypothetical protein
MKKIAFKGMKLKSLFLSFLFFLIYCGGMIKWQPPWKMDSDEEETFICIGNPVEQIVVRVVLVRVVTNSNQDIFKLSIFKLIAR